jgi:hypothetical protein
MIIKIDDDDDDDDDQYEYSGVFNNNMKLKRKTGKNFWVFFSRQKNGRKISHPEKKSPKKFPFICMFVCKL